MKKVLFRIMVAVPIGLLLLFILWQTVERARLQSALREEGSGYAIHPNFPIFFADSVQRNRRPLLTKLTDEELRNLELEIFPANLEQEEDINTARDMIVSYTSNVDRPDVISYDEAKVDLDYLYRYLKYTFAGFTYYGGEERFGPLFHKMGKEIQCAVKEESLAVQDFSNILKNNLFEITGDLHCYIDHEQKRQYIPEINAQYKFNDNYLFSPIDSRFVICLEGRNYLLDAINGKPPENYLAPTITEDGTISYMIWVSQNGTCNQTESVTVRLKDKTVPDMEIERKAPLSKTNSSDAGFDVPYKFEDRTGYFYLRNTSLQDDFIPYKDEMLRDSEQLSGNKPIIIDIRGHRGGDSTYILLWIFKYLRISKLQLLSIPIPTYSYELHTDTLSSMRKGTLVKGTKRGLFPRALNPLHPANGYPLHMKNDVPIFLLIDKNTGSSGEWWISYLRRLDNVVIVGENSAGIQIGGNVVGTRLIHSRIPVGFSTQINFESDGGSYENIGISPDLYVSPDVSLERVEALLKTYSIE